jgi:predicted enzyme related to lactoylglutathione lyase
MVHGTAVVWLPVSDMQRSLAFYRDTLGLAEVRVEGEWAELDANGLHLGLNGTEPVHEGETGGGVVAFQPEGDLDDAVEGLRGQGVDFADGISDHPWGRIAPFSDPDGNDLQLYEPPAG